mmetsp:Transcript_88821/g.248615  ORF Transcript_88821/g.248615 Transcript_88821/m.248615 type:complete len:205 (+) Transcript_88821:795-1409(+)
MRRTSKQRLMTSTAFGDSLSKAVADVRLKLGSRVEKPVPLFMRAYGPVRFMARSMRKWASSSVNKLWMRKTPGDAETVSNSAPSQLGARTGKRSPTRRGPHWKGRPSGTTVKFRRPGGKARTSSQALTRRPSSSASHQPAPKTSRPDASTSRRRSSQAPTVADAGSSVHGAPFGSHRTSVGDDAVGRPSTSSARPRSRELMCNA